MSKLTYDSKNNTWKGQATQLTQSATYDFDTAGKYVDKDIELNVRAKDAIVHYGGHILTEDDFSDIDIQTAQALNMSLPKIGSIKTPFPTNYDDVNEFITNFSRNSASGIPLFFQYWINILQEGWALAQETGGIADVPSLEGIILPKTKTFTIDDGIYDWTWSRDAQGNVVIT